MGIKRPGHFKYSLSQIGQLTCVETLPDNFGIARKILPREELARFLKQADNFTQDTRNWPDPTEPRASHPPDPKGCTCTEGQKLDCPIHGLNADPEIAESDHTWNLPENHPVSYPQSGPRNWLQAVTGLQTENALDTNSLTNRQVDPENSPGNTSDHRGFPSWKPVLAQDHRESGRFGPQSTLGTTLLLNEVGDSFTEPSVGFGYFSNMKQDLGLLVVGEHGFGPSPKSLEHSIHRGGGRSVSAGSFAVHASPRHVGFDSPPKEGHLGEGISS